MTDVGQELLDVIDRRPLRNRPGQISGSSHPDRLRPPLPPLRPASHVGSAVIGMIPQHPSCGCRP